VSLERHLSQVLSLPLDDVYRPPMVSVKLPKSEVSGFSSLESNEVAKFFQVKVERVAHFESRLLLVLSCLFARVGQAASYPACQV